MDLKKLLGKKLLFFDGAMGTILQSKGLPPGKSPETWNIENSDIIRDIHRSYLETGCNIITANTFGANRLNFGESSSELVRAGISIAREAVAEQAGDKSFVALDIGPTGRLLEPLGDLPFEEAYDVFKEMVTAGKNADTIIIETMTEIYELKAAILAAKENSHLPLLVSVMADEKGRLLSGSDMMSVVALLEGMGVDAIGLNCGFGPRQLLPHLRKLLKYASTPVFANPNAGIPHTIEGKTVFNLDAPGFTKEMKDIAYSGVWLMGGCCGTTPEHLKTLIHRYQGILPPAVEDKGTTLASSYSHAVEIGKDPKVIGEQLNPTGNRRISRAIEEEDTSTLMACALDQVKAGAQIIDVNIGVPGIDEARLLPRIVKKLQEVTNAPLMIDTSNPQAMEAALRIYNGKAFINSVNGKESSLQAVLPLAAKYGGVLVGLTLDEKGIPETIEERLHIAEKIIRRAAEYDIPKKDILIDVLTMAVSADPGAASMTLEALEAIKKIGLGTVLGVSNISFGLPSRTYITKTFFAMALDRGLDSAIMDPLSADMMSIYYAYRALNQKDENCLDYISFAKNHDNSGEAKTRIPTIKNNPSLNVKEHGNLEDPSPDTQSSSLKKAIIEGMKELIPHATHTLLKTLSPLEIIDNHIIPALNKVGKAFESGESFLPQLLMSADAAGRAFDIIKTGFDDRTSREKGKVILATVKGDIHDIGKNIVKVLLESYGYHVIDLGKDVPPEKITEVAIQEKIALVGLSALMTTTVPSMEETIKLLREKNCSCRVVVGGAVLTEEYAASIGADRYAKDAMATVQYADQIFAG